MKNIYILLITSVFLTGCIGNTVAERNENFEPNQGSQTSVPVSSPTSNNSEPIAPSPTSQVDSFEKGVFSSGTYGYQVSIPSKFTHRKSSDIHGSHERFVFENATSEGPIIQFLFGGSPGTIPDVNQIYIDRSGNEKSSGSYVFGGMKGIYISLPKGQGGGEEGAIPRVEIFAHQDGKVYGFSFLGTSDISDPTVKEVLSSFRFTQ